MLTKALSLILVMFLGLALGLETARYVHAQAADVGGAMLIGTGGTSSTSMVNIHRALLGFSLLATSGALLLSLRGHGSGRLRVGAWLSRQWHRFTTWLELTLDGLFDFDALNVGDGASALSASNRGLRLMTLYKQGFGEASLSELRQEMDATHRHPDGTLDWQASNAAIIKQMERRLASWEPCHGMHLMKLYNQRFGQGSASTVRQEMDAKHRTPEGRLDWRAANAALFNHMERKLAEVPVGVLPLPGTPEYEACAQGALDDAAKTLCTACGGLGHWSPDCRTSGFDLAWKGTRRTSPTTQNKA